MDELIKENRQDEFNIDLTDLFVDSTLTTTTEPAEIRKSEIKVIFYLSNFGIILGQSLSSLKML